MYRAIARRVEIWRSEHEFTRHEFYCTACGHQICSCYTRIVLRYECENTRYGSSLIVERHCDGCQ